jgi:hypothetical protein
MFHRKRKKNIQELFFKWRETHVYVIFLEETAEILIFPQRKHVI